MSRFEVIIDQDALAHNLAIVRELRPNSKILSVIKSNAYGHGVDNVYPILKHSDGLAVVNMKDAIHLRAKGFSKPIVLLNGFLDLDELELCYQHQLTPVIHQFEQYQLLSEYNTKSILPIWLKIDSGMNRLGFTLEHAESIYFKLDKLPHITVELLMTQWHSANDLQSMETSKPFLGIKKISQKLGLKLSLSNSAVILGTNQHSDWVRPGIMLYGVSPFNHQNGLELGLKPVMQFNSKLFHIRNCKKGETIGYGATWRCPQDMPVGIIPVGYADGYPHTAPSGTPVVVNGIRTQIIGAIAMDKMAIDLRLVSNAKVNMPVQLWGEHLSLEEIASISNRFTYELLSGVRA